MRFAAIVFGLGLSQLASASQAQTSLDAQNTECPYPVLLSNDDMQAYIKSYSQALLNEAVALFE